MQITAFIVQNYKGILLSSSFILSNICLVKFLIERKKLLDRHDQIKQKKILNVQQALKKAQYEKIKVYPSQQSLPLMSVRKDLHSNELWLLEPSLNKIAHQITSLINSLSKDRDSRSSKTQINSKSSFNSSWKVSCKNQKKPHFLDIKGFGQIVDDQIFVIQSIFIEQKEKGILKKIGQNLAYFLQLIFFPYKTQFIPSKDFTHKLALNENRTPFFKGPVIGFVVYTMNFLRDKPILLEAKIQGQEIISITMSSSKQKLLETIISKIWILNFRITGLMLISYVTYRMVQPFVRKLARKLKKRVKQLISGRSLFPKRLQKFAHNGEHIKDNYLCIICYTNCRNTVLFNCKHLIMCDECKQAYKDLNCPLCKAPIDDQKILAKE